MSENLLEVIKMDLKEQDEKNKRVYLRWLLGEVYLRNEGLKNTHTQNYIAKQKSKGMDPRTELLNLYAFSSRHLRYEDILEKLTGIILSDYENEKKEVSSFNEVMEKTISYYETRFDKYNKDEIRQYAKAILKNYLIDSNIKVFSSKNGTREYVSNHNRKDIIHEIMDTLKGENINDLIRSYSTKISDNWFSKNVINNEESINEIRDRIITEIENANLNNKQKDYLLNELEIENIDSLDRYVPSYLIEDYKEILSASNKKTKNM